jgi:glycosyltransferase involved in cell wall biosynthesis
MGVEHIVAIPSWYGSARGSGGGYFRDQALALQAAGYRVAMVAPDIYTLRDLRRGQAPRQFGRAVRVEDDGIPTWRREMLVLMPRLPYRNAVAMALCGLRLFAQYRAANGTPDLVQAHSILNAGIVALAIKRRYGVPFIVTEHSAGFFPHGRLRWWERDLVRRVIAGARQCIAVSPALARLLEAQYPGSSWACLPNPLGDAFVAEAAPPERRETTQPFVFLSAGRLSPEKGHALLIPASGCGWRATGRSGRCWKICAANAAPPPRSNFSANCRRRRCARRWRRRMPLSWPAISKLSAS